MCDLRSIWLRRSRRIADLSTGTLSVDYTERRKRPESQWKLAIFATVPALIVIAQSIYNLTDDVTMFQQNIILKENIRFSVEVAQIIHRIAIERGTTALFVTSEEGSSDLVKKRLPGLYTATNKTIKELSKWEPIENIDHFQNKELFLKYLGDFRSQVEQKTFYLRDVINFYTDINTALDSIIDTNVHMEIPFKYWTDLASFDMLLFGKEQAGIERALGSTYFSRGHMPFEDLLWYHEKKTLGVNFINRSIQGSHYVRKLFNDMYSGTVLEQQIITMREQIIANENLNRSVIGGTIWFDNMTEYINILNIIQDLLAARIVQHTIDENNALANTLTASAVQLTIAVIMVPIVIILVKNIIQISKKLGKRTRDLECEKHQTESLIFELDNERKRTEEVLYELLPKSVAMTLLHNGNVVPEAFDSATIMFSDVVNFTRISSHITPMQVVAMLNALYRTIDNCLEGYDVYKVETIGDGYMVASGLPIRNGDKHVVEIARLTLHLMKTVAEIDIPHLNQNLRLRIGFHTGPVVAGVVGIKMPRYCIFGDTVNTASRMESTGVPQKIQMSEPSANFLKTLSKFIITERGEISVKGKGVMRTYFLDGTQ